MAERCSAHDAALDASKPSPFNATDISEALAWLATCDDAAIDAAISEVRAYQAPLKRIASRAADLIEVGHWAASTLRAAFSAAAFPAGKYGKPVEGAYLDYTAIMAFERHWIGQRQHRNDGMLTSETAGDKAERVGTVETVAALRAYAVEL